MKQMRSQSLCLLALVVSLCVVSLLCAIPAALAGTPPIPKEIPEEAMEAILMQKTERHRNCKTEFGAKLGEFDGVPAFSNCNDHTESEQYYIIDESGREHDSEFNGGHHDQGEEVAEVGMKWQCVEYARRYLFLKHNLIFGSIPSAIDIWQFRFLHHPRREDHRMTHLDRRPNGETKFPPKKGDIIIWQKHEDDMPHGHVAIVVGATDSEVMIAEQNFEHVSWEGKNYARKLKLEHAHGYKVTDPANPEEYIVMGWMHPDFETEPHADYLHHDDRHYHSDNVEHNADDFPIHNEL